MSLEMLLQISLNIICCIALNITCNIITARKRSLEQGNVFTPVCHSVRLEGGSASRGVCIKGDLHPGAFASRGRGCIQGGGEICIQGGLHLFGQTAHRILRDTVNDRAVRILL